MRYFDISITESEIQNPTPKNLLRFSSYLQLDGMPGGNPFSGFYDPSSLEIEFDYISTSDSITPHTQLKIFGVDLTSIQTLQTLQTTNKLIGATLTVCAGMGQGMPLSDPNTARTIFTGEIQYAAGNWASQSDSTHPDNPNRTTCLELYCNPIKFLKKIQDEDNHTKNTKSKTEDVFNFKCKVNQKLADALQQCFKGYAIETNQIQEIVCKGEVSFDSLTFDNLIQKIMDTTRSWGMIRNYVRAGRLPDGTYRFFQNGKLDTPIPKLLAASLDFEELIGQPAYHKDEENDFNITITTPLRADIAIGDVIQLPKDKNNGNLYGILTALPDKGDQFLKSSAFAGYWQVQHIEYIAHSRDPDGQKWASTFGLKSLGDIISTAI